jgi:hypothetical protein
MFRSIRSLPAWGLQQSLLRCVNAFLIQTTETATANGRCKNEERLARWLLMADDRADGVIAGACAKVTTTTSPR